MIETKSKKRKDIVDSVNEFLKSGATFTEIASFFNLPPEIKTMEGKKWTTQNLFNFYNRHKEKNPAK